MTTADWIQCGIGGIYAVILAVMIAQLRDQRRAAAQQTDIAQGSLAAALAAVREVERLAALHARVADHAERAAMAAEAASAAAADANKLAIESEQRTAAKRAEDRRTAIIALADALRRQLDGLIAAYADHYMGHGRMSAQIVLAAASKSLAEVPAEVQTHLGPELTARMLATRNELDRAIDAAVNGRRDTPRDVAPVIEFGAKHFHAFVGELWVLAFPDKPLELLDKLLADARMRTPFR